MKNLFWAGRVLYVVLYVAAIIAWIVAGAWWWLVIFFLLHLVEALLFGLRLGSRNNKGLSYSLLATMLFGFFWYLALDKGYLE